MLHAIQVVATAYGIGCGGGTRTATGTRVHVGTIAVDPQTIPLGTKGFYKFGNWYAEDVGGAINGNRIDIWMPSCANAVKWGVRRITIYFEDRMKKITHRVFTSVSKQSTIELRGNERCNRDVLLEMLWMGNPYHPSLLFPLKSMFTTMEKPLYTLPCPIPLIMSTMKS